MRAQGSLLFISLALNSYLAVELAQAQEAVQEARALVLTTSRRLVLGCLPVYVSGEPKPLENTHL